MIEKTFSLLFQAIPMLGKKKNQQTETNSPLASRR